VIARTAMAYLELEKVQHSWKSFAGTESAEKILQGRRRQGKDRTQVEVTKAQLTKAQVVERILQLEGREDELEVFLRYQLGLAEARRLKSHPKDLPEKRSRRGKPVAMALTSNTRLQLAQSDVRAKNSTQGEKRGIGRRGIGQRVQLLAKFITTQFFIIFNGTISTPESRCRCRYSVRERSGDRAGAGNPGRG